MSQIFDINCYQLTLPEDMERFDRATDISAPDYAGLERPVHIQHREALSFFRKTFPQGPGNKLSDDTLVDLAETAISHCIALRIGGSLDWLKRPEIQSLMLLLVYMNGPHCTRKLDGRRSETHPIAVAHRFYNSSEVREEPFRFARTFAALGHDVVEDVSGRTKDTDKAVFEMLKHSFAQGETLPADTQKSKLNQAFDAVSGYIRGDVYWGVALASVKNLTDPLQRVKEDKKTYKARRLKAQNEAAERMPHDDALIRAIDKKSSNFGDLFEFRRRLRNGGYIEHKEVAHAVQGINEKRAIMETLTSRTLRGDQHISFDHLRLMDAIRAQIYMLLPPTNPAQARYTAHELGFH